VELVSTLLSVAFGAILSTALQQFVWKRQQKYAEDREMKKERARVVERFREVGGLLIEINRGFSSKPQVNQIEVTTTALIEGYRLRRELLNAAAAVREAFPDRELLFVTAFQRKITEKFPLDLPPEAADSLRKELESALHADVSTSDKRRPQAARSVPPRSERAKSSVSKFRFVHTSNKNKF
jgi:hypothetical protein